VKVKQSPRDFVVEERARIGVSDQGPHAVYLLKKTDIGTLEALRAVRRRWRVPARELGFGGLKDRHATTTQWVTIPGGPRKNLEEKAFRLTYEGRSDVPMSRMLLEGNRFRIRLRDLSAPEARAIAGRLADAATHGLPAYFDDQRFGSLRGGGGFAALHLVRGDAEKALRAVIASPAKEDRAAVRARKRAIAASWGRFEEVVAQLDSSPMRAPVLHLARHPGDFEGAFALLDREERALLTSAYASAVWNRAVSRRVAEATPEAERLVVHGAAGPLVFPRTPEPLRPLEDAVLPLPAPNARADDPAWQEALERALADDGLTLDRLAPKRRLGIVFRATKRPVLFRPERATASAPMPDDLNRGRFAVDLSFGLARGLYATIVIKRMTAAAAARGAGARP
jgi:tRNA pseudouridine13 synthase